MNGHALYTVKVLAAAPEARANSEAESTNTIFFAVEGAWSSGKYDRLLLYINFRECCLCHDSHNASSVMKSKQSDSDADSLRKHDLLIRLPVADVTRKHR